MIVVGTLRVPSLMIVETLHTLCYRYIKMDGRGEEEWKMNEIGER